MIDIILKLIDKCIELVKRREEVTGKLFEDFVSPAFKELDAVHKNYLESFQHYRDMLTDTQFEMGRGHPILSELAQDALFSRSLRAKLCALKPLQKDPLVGTFVGSIFRYLDTAATNPLEGYETEVDRKYFLGNAIRTSFANGLYSLMRRSMPESQMRAYALEILDDIVSRIQCSYEEVVEKFTETKLKLLTRI